MRILRLIIVPVALTLSACSGVGRHERGPVFASLPKEEQAIYTAVLEAMFSKWESYGRRLGLPRSYFISIQGKDAPTDLLAAWKEKNRHAYPGSLYRHGLGVRLSLGAIEREGEQRARVYGGYLFDAEGGEWGPFVLVHENGQWIFSSWTPDMFAQNVSNKVPDPTLQPVTSAAGQPSRRS